MQQDNNQPNGRPAVGSAPNQGPGAAVKKTKRLPNWLKLKPTTKKEWLIGGTVIIFLLVGGIFGGLYLYKKVSKSKPVPEVVIAEEKPEPPKPSTEPSRLTGVLISPELNKRPITGIMIENSPDARPQAGLTEAGVVFEAIAEGGITRFIALYLEGQPGYIGPVRSVRPYYLDWLMPFDGAIVHAGGSAQGLSDIGAFGVKDLNHNSSAFQRVSNRFAPHNLYTGFPALDEYAKSRGYTSSTFTSWPRKDEKAAQPVSVAAIDINPSSFNYSVHYDYDPAINAYRRALAGRAHVDEKSGVQITPKVVVVLVINRTQAGIYSVYETVGSGPMYVYQDGMVIAGRWHKAGRKDQYDFKDSAGQSLMLNRGQTWVTVVASEAMVSPRP